MRIDYCFYSIHGYANATPCFLLLGLWLPMVPSLIGLREMLLLLLPHILPVFPSTHIFLSQNEILRTRLTFVLRDPPPKHSHEWPGMASSTFCMELCFNFSDIFLSLHFHVPYQNKLQVYLIVIFGWWSCEYLNSFLYQ